MIRARQTLNRATLTRNALAVCLYLAATSAVHRHCPEDTENVEERAHVD